MLALRRAAAKRYRLLPAEIVGIELPQRTLPRREISRFIYSNRLQASLKESPVQVSTCAYLPPIHLQEAWKTRCRIVAPLAVPEEVARTLALPLFNRITSMQQSAVHSTLVTALVSGYTWLTQ
jgi:dTDP-4-amino-4,6-dideoxygalactose transaminase